MLARYKGYTKEQPWRLAEIGFDDDEMSIMVRIEKLLRLKGWDFEVVTDNYAACQVSDRDEYNIFMKDWKACKKCILNCIKYGF